MPRVEMAGAGSSNGEKPPSPAASPPPSPSPVEEQTAIQKKYGGLTPKKPLISRDHERAYFDSADWALCKQSANNSEKTGAIESLKPKLKRTPHQQLSPRKPTCDSS